VLCHALKVTESFWHITEHMRSLSRDSREGFAARKLQDAIQEGGVWRTNISAPATTAGLPSARKRGATLPVDR
jgi:hypothetical protein